MRNFPLLAALVIVLASCSTSKEQYLQRGNDLAAKGQFAEATLEYRNAIKKDARFAEAYFRLGQLTARDGVVTEAITLYERAVEIEPKHPQARLALSKLYLEGLTYIPRPPQVFYDRLKKMAAGYLSDDPKSFDGNRLHGHLAMLDSKAAEAIPRFRAALEAKPDSFEVTALLTQALLAAGQVPEAEALGRKSLASQPGNGALYDLLYFHYRRVKNPAEAEKVLLARAAAEPKDSLPVLQLARHYRSLNQPAQMEEMLAKLTAAGSPYVDGVLAAGDFYAESGDLPRALEHYQKGNTPLHQKRVIDTYLRSNKPELAGAAVDALLKTAPDDKEAIAAKAALRAASGKPSDIDVSIADFQKLALQDPKSARYQYDLARLYRLRGQADDARKYLLKTVEIDGGHVAALEDLAGLAIQRANAQDAMSYSMRALNINPRLPRTRLVYTAALALQGKNAEARQEINGLIKEYPNLQEAQMQLALLNVQERRFAEAEALYKKFYRPGLPDVRVLRGLVELGFASGKPEPALQALQQEVRVQPESAERRLLLATTAGRMKKPEIALEQFEWLRKNVPPSANLEMALGMAHQEMGDWNSAIRQYESARKLEPKNPDALASLGYALQQAGRPADAVLVYRESLAARPNTPVVMNNLAMALTDSGGDLAEALQLAQSVAAKAPANPAYSDAVGIVYLKRKEHASAVQAFRAAVSKDSENISFRLHLAQALLESGNKAGAKAEVDAALARRPTEQQRKELAELLAR